jgi:hypothetical protein
MDKDRTVLLSQLALNSGLLQQVLLTSGQRLERNTVRHLSPYVQENGGRLIFYDLHLIIILLNITQISYLRSRQKYYINT